jgi:hypothetical protein
MSSDDGDAASSPFAGRPRGAPLLATWTRWIASTAFVAVVFAALLQGSLLFVHSAQSIGSYTGALAAAVLAAAVLLFWVLQAEEARLARELRTARTGTAALRSMVAARRQQLPFFARLFSTKLGTAAVLLADGERAPALELLAAGSPLMQGGRLGRLRAIVEADANRAGGGEEALGRCIDQLASGERTGNREADLYALHVLVKAVLERGDGEAALRLIERLERSDDEDESLYIVWLEAWFELERPAGRAGRAASEGEVRLAALLARAHGAEKLVEKLEERASAIARPAGRE